MHAPIELLIRGTPALRIGGRAVGLRLQRGLALLAVLAVPTESRRPMSRSTVAGLLWADADDRTARARLRRLVHEINHRLGVALIHADAGNDTLQLGAVQCDLHALRDGACDAGADPAAAAALLEPGAHELLAGFSLDSGAFSDWLQARRAEHAALVTRALQAAAERWLAAGQTEAARAAAERLIHIDPLAEDGYIALIAALARRGDASAVETTYFDCADSLRRELGVKPSGRVEQAYAQASAQLATPIDDAPVIRYADTGAGAVAYVCLGDGPQTLVVSGGLMSNLEVCLEEPRVRRLLDHLAQRFRVVMFDRRGCGLSERVGVEPTVAAGAQDIEAVLDAIGVQQAWLFGLMAGGTVGIEFAATRRERTAGLLLFGTPARGAWAEDYPWAMQPGDLTQWVERLVTDRHCAEGLSRFAPSAAHAPAVQAWYARLLRQSVSRNGAEALLRGYLAMDVRHRLQRVDAPTLVMQREGDRVVPPSVGRLLAYSIPRGELAMLEGEDHFPWHGDADAVLGAIDGFVDRTFAQAQRLAAAQATPPGVNVARNASRRAASSPVMC